MGSSPLAEGRRLVDEPSIARALQLTAAGALIFALTVSGVTALLGWSTVPRLCLIAAASAVAALAFGRAGRIRTGFLLLCAGVSYTVLHAAATHDGVQSIGLTILPVLIVVASLLLERLRLVLFSAGVILSAAGMVAIRVQVLHLEQYNRGDLGDLFILGLTCAAAALIGHLLSERIHEGLQQSRASERRYRRIFENIQDVYFEMRPDGVLLELSPAAAELLGNSVDLLLSRTLAAFCEDRSEFNDFAATVRERGRVANRELAIRNARGRLIHVLVNASLQNRGEDGDERIIGSIRDISEWRRAEGALRESEERLRLAAEATGAGTFDYDPLTEKLVWSEIAKRQFGLPADAEVDYARFMAMVHPQDRERLQELGKAAARPGNGGRMVAEHRIIRADDGQTRWLAVSARMLFDPTGRPSRLIGTSLDITDRKRLEEDLRRRAEELQTVMDVAPVALFIAHDPECRNVSLNGEGNALLDFPPGANSPDAPAGFTPAVPFFRNGAEVPAEDLPLQVAAVRGIAVRDFEVEVRLPSGRKRILCGNASPLRDDSGRVRGAIAAALDVTEARQLAEARLRESEDRFREAADAAPVIMWLSDPDKRLIFVNEQMVRFTGMPAGQLLGNGWQQALHPDDLESSRVIYEDGVNRHLTYQAEYRARRADGEYRHMLGSTRPRWVGSEYAGQIGTVIDITELKLRQEQDVARQKLESVGMLASGIAHDFNNLLGSVLSQSELAISQLAAGNRPDLELKRIGEVAGRGAEIVRQLMIYAGIEKETVTGVDVSGTVKDMLELLGVSVSNRAALDAELSAGLPPIRASAAQIRQIVMNLVINASEAITDTKGTIRVKTDLVAVGPNTPLQPAEQLTPGDYVQLQVSDNGCGLTQAAMARIFDPFFTTKAAGRGLGLAVVQGLVRSLNGAILVDSRPGAGAAFRILLPCVDSAARDLSSPVEPVADDAAPRRDASILIVEDESLLREAVAKMLTRRGFRVIECGDGASAVETLGKVGPSLDLVLLDVSLPGAPSSEVFAEALRVAPGIQVIATSAYSENEAAATLKGLRHFIRKPYRLTDLLDLIRRTLAP
jgi:two-component system cell cycle sensor histidine kinase/response regulator CckA